MSATLYSYNFPVVVTAQGLTPQTPQSLLSQLTTNVALTNPGYTNNLPGGLIEDVSSTEVAAIALCDQARVELVNSITPNGANLFLLTQLGQVYGVTQGAPTSVSVALQFSASTPGYTVSQGTVVSDGTYSYALQSTVTIAAAGTAAGTAVALLPSQTQAPAANTVTQLKTSLPPGIALSFTNPTAGTPALAAETPQSFRSRVLQAGLAASVSTARYVKTLLAQVPGVVPQLISVQQGAPGIRVVVGGSADPSAIANAIMLSVSDPSDLVGSAVSALRNVTVSVTDYPDTYSVLYVSPVLQQVTLTLTWNTSLPNFAGGATFPSLLQGPLSDYINALTVAQPINLLEMNAIVQSAVSGVLDPNLLTRLVYTVLLNGVQVSPLTGYSSIAGDPEGYFQCTPSSVTVVQG